MARGWESKSVESQMEESGARHSKSTGPPLTAEQIRRQRERESLELSRTRVLKDLETAANPRYREQLQSALRHLEQKLTELNSLKVN
jgi:hypothetical protein